ncbi:MAG: hypothetical protein GVY08_04555 [Bacteroidetes bacterium]|jgi:hypothetical protein|nr:hypothetical protein [Bacteroidota bacterium]
MMKYTSIMLTVMVMALISGCIETSDPENPGRFEITFEVEDVGNELIAGTDTLVVNELKFSLEEFRITDVDSVVLGSEGNVDTFIFFHNDELPTENLVFSTSIGFVDVDEFIGYDIFVEPVKSSDNIADMDFFGEDENYSLIISGTINGSEFEYKSFPEFDRMFSFQPVSLTTNSETLLIEKTIDFRDLLVDPDTGELIDPRNEENRQRIDASFEDALRVSVSAISRVVG